MKKYCLLLVLFLAGCAATQMSRDASAGHIGCPPNEIEISNETSSMGSASWTATCKGKKFFCSAIAGNGKSWQTNCKEELK